MEDCLEDVEGGAEEPRGVTEGHGGTRGAQRGVPAGVKSREKLRQGAGARKAENIVE